VSRKIISRGANFFATFLLKSNISDLTGSFRLYKREVFEKLTKTINSSGYAFQMEIMIRAIHNNNTITEIPITFVDRLMGKSKLGMSEVINYFKTVIRLYVTL
jgi:dolichol-phosphate mannosyltransferase